MKAIILAAGIGKRMRPITNDTHKTLLKIADKTIIQRIIESLLDNGVDDIVIVAGYRVEDLTNHISQSFPNLNYQVVLNTKYESTNNIYSLSLAFQNIEIEQDILLIESDLIYDPKIIKRLIDSKRKNVALLDKYKSGMDGTVVEIENDIITNIIPPHLQGSQFNFTNKYKSLNIYKFSKEFCRSSFKRFLKYYSKVFDDNCYYEIVLGMLVYVQKEAIHAEVLSTEKWTEIDDPNDLSQAEFMFSEQKIDILQKSHGGYWNFDFLDFCFIRNMYFPEFSMIADIRNNLDKLISNYGTSQDCLNQKAAFFLKCNKTNLTVLNGASQAYPIVRNYFKKQKALIPDPTFGEYTRIFSQYQTYDDKVGFNFPEICSKSNECDVIVFVNPNNPTGSMLENELIIDFAKKNPSKFLIIDESFIEFSDQESFIDILEVTPLNNIIILKSLSKSWGIAGLRLGFLYTNNEPFNKFLQEQIPIWNINAIAEYFLETILKFRDELVDSIKRTTRDRDIFLEDLRKTPGIAYVFPSSANFILVRLEKDLNCAYILKKLLIEHKIYVKDASQKINDSQEYLRIAVRLPHENRYFIKSFIETIS